MAERVTRETRDPEPLDVFERAVLFALRRALARDRAEAGRAAPSSEVARAGVYSRSPKRKGKAR